MTEYTHTMFPTPTQIVIIGGIICVAAIILLSFTTYLSEFEGLILFAGGTGLIVLGIVYFVLATKKLVKHTT